MTNMTTKKPKYLFVLGEKYEVVKFRKLGKLETLLIYLFAAFLVIVAVILIVPYMLYLRFRKINPNEIR